MRFLRRIASILGLLKDDNHDAGDEDDEDRGPREDPLPRGPTKGFSVQVPVAVDKAHPVSLIAPSSLGQGGVQGLLWYAKRLRIDEDGDVADEFFDEVLPVLSISDDRHALPKFQLKHRTRPAKVRSLLISADGTVHQSVEFRGQLQWI